MITGQIKIRDMSRLHLRPATKLSKVACQYKSSIKLSSGSTVANVKSIISLLGACVKFGEVVELNCEGEDEKAAFEMMKGMLEGSEEFDEQ